MTGLQRRRPPARTARTVWLVLGGAFGANAVFQAVNDQTSLLVLLSLIAGLAALWAAWADGRPRPPEQQ